MAGAGTSCFLASPKCLGKGFHSDRFTLGHDQQPFDDVTELPDVALPGIFCHSGDGLGRELSRPEVVFLGEVAAEVFDEKGDILFFIPERRRIDRNDVEAEEEIVTELPFADLFFQVLVGGGDNPDVDLADLARPNPLDLPFFEDPQHLRLGFEAHVSDFVQEDGPAVGQLELAHLALGGPGERALFVAEKLAFDQFLRDGRAVDLDKRFFGSHAVAVNGPGDELLPGAAFPVDENRGVSRGCLEEVLPELLHQGVLADELIALLGPSPQVLTFPPQGVLVEGVSDGEEDPVPVEGLFQEFEGTEFGGFHGRLNGPLPRDHDHFGAIGALFDLGQDIQTIPSRHFDVKKNELEVNRLLDQGESRLPVGGFEEMVALVLEDHSEGFPDVFLVIDDQDLGFALAFHVRLLRGILSQPTRRSQLRSVLDASFRPFLSLDDWPM
ncbi:MAG: hypothetical protein WBC70_10705 [Candidatus Aminicenantales bacterium]